MDETIRLDLNESPIPPPREVIEAACGEVLNANRYPEGRLFNRLKSLISEYTGVSEDLIFITAGADGALQAVFLSLAAGGTVVYPIYSFPMFKRYARLVSARMYEVAMRPVGDIWSLNTDQLFDVIRNATLTIIDNPNNPTGSPLVSLDTVRDLLDRTNGFVVIDEAYYEFHGETTTSMLESHDNLVVVRSFSKAFSLAGLRIGYILAGKRAASLIKDRIPLFTATRPSIAAAIAALENPKYMYDLVSLVSREREYLREELLKLGVKAYRSRTNFILADTGVEDMDVLLADRGIRVRKPGISPTMIRITVGKPRENRILVKTLKEILEENLG